MTRKWKKIKEIDVDCLDNKAKHKVEWDGDKITLYEECSEEKDITKDCIVALTKSWNGGYYITIRKKDCTKVVAMVHADMVEAKIGFKIVPCCRDGYSFRIHEV